VIDSFNLSVIGYALALAAICAMASLGGRPRRPAVSAALGFLQIAVVVAALLDVIRLVRADEGAQVVTNLGYLVTSVIVLPVIATAVRMDLGRWGNAAAAVGCVLLAVISLRLHQTVGSNRA
jgi:FtsH-binding integral membrane protein